MKKSLLGAALFCILLMVSLGWTQTFELGGKPSSSAQDQKKSPNKKNKNRPAAGETQPGETGMGWGTSIEVGRGARAAQEALKRGDYAGAMTYAQRLTQDAPNSSRNWFLLGYTARLAGRYQISEDAYKRGLALEPKSIEGLSGFAQTYMRMGKDEDAKRLLMEVIAANPRRAVDLSLAGELFLKTGDLPQATSLLERSEAAQASSHTEVLLAITYMKQKQPGKAKALLDRAVKRSPGNSDVFRTVAQYYRESQDYKSAIEVLKRVPHKNAEILSELGYTYELAGMKKESADTYTQAAALAPNSVTIQLSAAQAELRIGDFDQARTYLTRAARIDPDHYRLHATRGDLAALERRDDEAAKEYTAALAVMPENPPEGVLYRTQLRLDLVDAYRNMDDDASVQAQVALAEKELAGIQIEGVERVEYLRLRAAIRGLGGRYGEAEADLKEALALSPNNDKVMLQYGTLLWKTGRKEEAAKEFTSVLDRDPKNRDGLESMGYLSRDVGDNKIAELYFTRMAAAYPNDYVPYVALGDLYTATRQYEKAETNYERAYKFAPSNTQVIIGGSNAAIDAHKPDLAGEWVARATGTMKDDPRVIRETERYLFHKGKFAESAKLGEVAVQKLPHDRDAAVYLGYDYYNLGRYDETLALVSRYETILPKEPNFPMLAGHVHRQNQLLQEAIDDFTRALEKDPKMVEAMVDRGYVRNDMQDGHAAIRDFEPALKISPDNGIAHLGLAYAQLQMHQSHEALGETEKAEKLIGESGATHMARATAYRQMRNLGKAETEYRLALKYAPDDLKVHVALADTLYHARRYGPAITELETALQLSPHDPLIYSSLAAAHAQLHHREETFKYIEAAERESTDQSAVLLADGDALLTLGDRNAAMDRFTRALDAPDANRVDVRLEFAKLFVRDGKYDQAKQEVALAFAESRIGEASPLTTDDLVEAANVFLAGHDFTLAERYFSKARDMGASDDVVAVGLADTYLAQGKDREAEQTLAALGKSPDYAGSYDYQLAAANVYNQKHDTVHALSAFAHASQLAEDDETAANGLQQVAGDEGTQIYSPNLAMRDGISSAPIFVDSTIYEMDSKFIGTPPAPYASQGSGVGANFHYHHEGWPVINSYFGEQNYHGTFSLPNQAALINQNTFDTIFNVGTTPILRLGNQHFILDPGVQFTLRRDTESPVQLNQNLFRSYLYMASSPMFQWLTLRGYGIYETGPFTEQNLHSRDLVGNVEFEVGRPWGKTSFITGYSVRDLLFRPRISEYFTTSTWGGIQRKFTDKLSVTVLATYVRAWRVEGLDFTIAQLVVPGARAEYKINKTWSVSGAGYMTHGEGFALYNNVQSGFLVTYTKGMHRKFDDGTGALTVDYPVRFSFGIQQQSFYNFTPGVSTTNWRPVLNLTFF